MHKPIARLFGPFRLPAPGSQRGLVGEDPLTLLDPLQNVVGERLKLEADLAHPLCHQRAAELDLVAGIDRLLPVERQAIGVFCDGDLRQERLGGDAAFDDMDRSRRLDHAIAAPEDIFRATVDDHPELRRRHVETLRDVLADQPLSRSSQPTGTSGSITCSTHSRCAAKPLRGRGAHFGCS